MSRSLSFENVFSGLITVSSSIISKSYVKVNDSYKQSLGLFLIVCGLPGKNKSTGISLFKDAYYDMEEFFHFKNESNFEEYDSENLTEMTNKFKSSINQSKLSNNEFILYGL